MASTKVEHRSQGVNIPDTYQTKDDKIIKLIGRKALTQCKLNELTVTALLDTGAQVSMVDRVCKERYLPSVEVRPLRDLLGYDIDLEILRITCLMH